MEHHLLTSLASIIILGVGAQWLAWRLSLPSILVLLVIGFIAGPVTGILHPDELFGDLLFPLVSLSVGIILFEGGMSLRFTELRGSGHVVRNLVSIGALVTWFICTLAAVTLIDLPLSIATLLGAILVVTGPTVIGPLLRVVRPTGRVGAVLKWEGIVIDPVGASLAVLVFEAIIAEELQAATAAVVDGVLRTILAGGLLGMLGAAFIVLLLRRYWVPDFLQNLVVLMVVIGVFLGADLIQEESGLLAVTCMGVLLANQRMVVVKQILEFKENLRVLLIGSLFIVLTARLNFDNLIEMGLESLLFLAVVLFVARPAAVLLSTVRSELNWRERVFLAWMAPRGIVAASVASLFALRMSDAGIEGAEQMVPAVFLVIMGTVTFYSLTAVPVARWLRVSLPNPQGLLIAGAHPLSRAIGYALHQQGFQVLLVDTNAANCEEANALGLRTFHGSVFAEEIGEEVGVNGLGRLLALTANDEVNALAALEWGELFGSAEIYQLLPQDASTSGPFSTQNLRGRPLFRRGVTYTSLMERLQAGGTIQVSKIPEQPERPAEQFPSSSIPLFIVTEDQNLVVVTADRPVTPRPGQRLISLDMPPGYRVSDTTPVSLTRTEYSL
jgi:NhaP-type Na+/H+ or K+/H+ antiporter